MESKDITQLPRSLETAAAAIADRCAHDPDWMAKFKADPYQALQETIGRKLPDDLQIHLHQNDNDNWHVPIAGSSGKLRDDDLQKIAGGEILIANTIVMAGVIAAGVGVGAAVGGGVAAGGAAAARKKKKK